MPRRKQPRAKRITPEQIAEIRRLHSAGHTQRDIVQTTGISRTTIHRVLTDNHLVKHRKSATDAEEGDSISYFDGPIERCPRCGRKVHMPCMPCRIDSMAACGQVPESTIQKADRRQIARDW
ncbi:helix-turn-helix domain-containing protein [Blastopirellula marina]|uniref:Resolvase HTH domain-containing protein n=1 Tax=Blastopirellula marina TaxID=124 RepID=A0A2S8GLZ2_9BACT|nr:helix-turn-helix domain-containing protein [Blastopirellula marina]PQO45452.1 hypothetical protein C5Y93_13455 [Blastopirellula marina]